MINIIIHIINFFFPYILALHLLYKKQFILISENNEKYMCKNNFNIVLEELKNEKYMWKNNFNIVLKELKKHVIKDKKRGVCKNCNELGHSISSKFCKINIYNDNILLQKIKNNILSQNSLDKKTIDEIILELSILLQITFNKCKSLYNKIPLIELSQRDINIESYLDNINKLSSKCNECYKNIYCIQTNTNRLWKENIVCDTCWSKHDNEREIKWNKIKLYKPIQCSICSSIQLHIGERYHYDHLNMFEKNDSICNMVNSGVELNDIYVEIDKCQIVCLSCHHIITDIENKLIFTRIKINLTKKINNNEITQHEYDNKSMIYQKIYKEQMSSIYKKLKNKL